MLGKRDVRRSRSVEIFIVSPVRQGDTWNESAERLAWRPLNLMTASFFRYHVLAARRMRGHLRVARAAFRTMMSSNDGVAALVRTGD
jgi:hypothetical protein